ncbi:hypothetical protein JOD01_003406 [Brevibacillus fulvus]|uniref:Uncharacterized protein n=1 Tax=Brevibacillus fulvus TaxID=1125967 RepID=A0A939BVT0_9BACL|nr:hypothetical protein [Brevibacillus fulvus]
MIRVYRVPFFWEVLYLIGKLTGIPYSLTTIWKKSTLLLKCQCKPPIAIVKSSGTDAYIKKAPSTLGVGGVRCLEVLDLGRCTFLFCRLSR